MELKDSVDKIKFGLALLLLAAGIAGFYYLRDNAMVIRVAVVLTGVLLAATMAWFTVPGKQFFAFSQESADETRKVVWPSRKETIQTTGIVFAFIVVMAIFLWLVDAGLLLAMKHLMGRGE